MIKHSLQEFKQYKPLIVDEKTNIVKIGNGRLQAMKELGWKECYCILIDFKEHEGIEVLDNRLNELSYWNDEGIDKWLLSNKGVDWWGIDTQKSIELFEKEKKKHAKPSNHNKTKKDVKSPKCPCCGMSLHRVQREIL